MYFASAQSTVISLSFLQKAKKLPVDNASMVYSGHLQTRIPGSHVRLCTWRASFSYTFFKYRTM